MEKKLVIVPFDVEIAKKIARGESEGRIITRVGGYVRNITFDIKGEYYPISAIVEADVNKEKVLAFTNKGTFYLDEKTDDFDLMLEIPEYLTFKDGDVIAYDDSGTIGLIKGMFYQNDSGDMCSEAYIIAVKKYIYTDNSLIMKGARLATESEKQNFINVLKASKEPKVKIYLKRFFDIVQSQQYEFKPFDKVLVRQCHEDKWEAMLFSNYTDKIHKYRCCGMNYMYCIPYNEKTAHLLGSTENWED